MREIYDCVSVCRLLLASHAFKTIEQGGIKWGSMNNDVKNYLKNFIRFDFFSRLEFPRISRRKLKISLIFSTCDVIANASHILKWRNGKKHVLEKGTRVNEILQVQILALNTRRDQADLLKFDYL